MAFPVNWLAAGVSAALFGLAFPPFGLWPLSFVCLVPLLLALRQGSLLVAAFLAGFWALLAACILAPALAPSIANYYAQPLWLGWAVALGLFSTMASLYYMAFAPVYRAILRRSRGGPGLPLLVACAWVTVELARGRLFTGTGVFIGNPWGLLGYSLAGIGPMAQIASVTGVYGLSFAVIAVNAALTEWTAALFDPARSSRRAAAAFALACTPVAAIWAFGSAVLHNAPPTSRGDGFVPISIVQADISSGRRWRSDLLGENLEIYLDLTHQSFRAGRPAIVFWPEGALTFFLDVEADYRHAIARTLAEGNAELLVGGPSGNGDRSPPFYNSVFQLSPRGVVRSRYDKQVLVPFSEYFPFGTTRLMRRRLGDLSVIERGMPRPLPETRAGAAGILVCNEAMLPEIAGRRVRDGAQYLFSPSNETWIADDGFAEHMLRIVALRAVEQRRFLVRASTSGPSAVIDPWGRILVSSPASERQLLLGRIRPLNALSPYGRAGDAFAALCAAATLVGLAASLRRMKGLGGFR